MYQSAKKLVVTYKRKSSTPAPSTAPARAAKMTPEELELKIAQVFSKPASPTRHDDSESVLDTAFDPASASDRRHVRSVHELLEAGVNSRFLDEIEYLVDGLAPVHRLALGTRTRYLGQIVALVVSMGPAYASRMRAHGFITRIVDSLEGVILQEMGILLNVVLLLICVANDVSKMDVFLSPKAAVEISHRLLQHADTCVEHAHFKELPAFKNYPQLCYGSLALWLLTKLVVGALTMAGRERCALVELCRGHDVTALIRAHVAGRTSSTMDEACLCDVRKAYIVLDVNASDGSCLFFQRSCALAERVIRSADESPSSMPGALPPSVV